MENVIIHNNSHKKTYGGSRQYIALAKNLSKLSCRILDCFIRWYLLLESTIMHDQVWARSRCIESTPTNLVCPVFSLFLTGQTYICCLSGTTNAAQKCTGTEIAPLGAPNYGQPNSIPRGVVLTPFFLSVGVDLTGSFFLDKNSRFSEIKFYFP